MADRKVNFRTIPQLNSPCEVVSLIKILDTRDLWELPIRASYHASYQRQERYGYSSILGVEVELVGHS